MGIIIAWIVLSIIIGLAGDKKEIGGTGAFFLSLLLSPLIGLIAVLISKEKKQTFTCKHCAYQSTENSYYCPRCLKDTDGFTAEENKERFKHGAIPTAEKPAEKVTAKLPIGWYILFGGIILIVILAALRNYF